MNNLVRKFWIEGKVLEAELAKKHFYFFYNKAGSFIWVNVFLFGNVRSTSITFWECVSEKFN